MAHLTLRIGGPVIVPFGRLEPRPNWRMRGLSEAADCERQRLSWPSPLIRQRREGIKLRVVSLRSRMAQA